MLDVSAALAWAFADERDQLAIAMSAEVARSGACVPLLFRWELQNALLTASRRRRISDERAREMLADFDALRLEVDTQPANDSLFVGLEPAQRFELTAYDAAYLEVASRRKLPLMTRDGRLSSAASALDLLWSPKPTR